MGSPRDQDATSALPGPAPVAVAGPVSPELALVCPELRAQELERMRAQERAATRAQPVAAAPERGRRPAGVPVRPAVALLAAVPLLAVAGSWLGGKAQSAPAGAVAAPAPVPAASGPAGSKPGAAARTTAPTGPARVTVPRAASRQEVSQLEPEPAPPPAPVAWRPPRAPAPLRLSEAVETEPPVHLLGTLPDPTPPRRRLAPTIGRQLLGLARARRVDWAVLLARARMRAGSMHTISMHRLRPLARTLATAETSGTQRGSTAARAGSGRERVLAGYYRAVGLDALISGLAGAKPVLAARVLRDPRITIYPGGRSDIVSGRVDVRVLALLLYLARTDGQVTVASLVSGHRSATGGQGSSTHAYGLAVDVSALGGVPVRGNQQPGGRIDRALRSLLLLPPEVRPTELISLLDLGGDSLALADHADYVHLGYAPPGSDPGNRLLALWQSAGARYGVPWQVLAAINKIETDNGRLLVESPAGAIGWMQFLPSTWQRYGTDANGDGTANPGDPTDAIFSAARYLQAAGAATDLPRAIWAYNHASWYVDEVLAQARSYG